MRQANQLSRWMVIGIAGAATWQGSVVLAAGTIHFDQTPGAMPGLAIDNQFADLGVTFSVESGPAPVLAKVGDGAGPVAYSYGVDHVPNGVAPGAEVGAYFLCEGTKHVGVGPLDLSFASPVASVGGDILDIDHADAWTIEALSAGGVVLASENVGISTPGAGDGQATPFLVGGSTDDISSVRLVYTGDGADPGYGFANFSFSSLPGDLPGSTPPTAVPLPPAFATGAVALTGLWLFRKKLLKLSA